MRLKTLHTRTREERFASFEVFAAMNVRVVMIRFATPYSIVLCCVKYRSFRGRWENDGVCSFHLGRACYILSKCYYFIFIYCISRCGVICWWLDPG